MTHWGKVPLNSVLPFFVGTYDGDTGASVAWSAIAVTDIEVYKGTSMTQRSSDSGYVLLDTDGIDVDTMVGIGGFSIDTSDNTDAGFFVAGSFYTVVVASVTIDAQTVNYVAGTFWLGPALTVAGVDEVDLTHIAGSAVSTTTAQLGVNTVQAGGTAWGSGAITAASIATDAIGAAEIADGAITAATFAAGAIDATAIATGAIDADAVAADAATEIANAVWDTDATGRQTQGTFGQAIGDPGADTNTIFKATVTDAAGATVGVDVVAVQADTDNIQTRLPAALVGGRMDSDVAAIQAGAITAAVIATDAIDADALADNAITAATFAADAITAAKVAADVTAEIADGVWDEDATGHQTLGTFGQAIGDPVADTTTIYQSVVTDAAGTNIAVDIIAIEGQTDDIGVAGAGLTAIPWNAAWDAEVESEVDDALGAGTGTALTAIPWNASWDAEVQSEVTDALEVALSDSVPADGALPSLKQAVYMVAQFLMERSLSGTTLSVRKVDGSTALMTFTLNDATEPTSITRAT